MGCEVQLSTKQPYFRTFKVKLVTLLHFFRAIVFAVLSFMVDDVFMVFLALGVAEVFIAWWFWNLKIEGWGLSMGICILHLIFPSALGIEMVSTILVLAASLVQAFVLGLIRAEGGFSYVEIALLDQAEKREATPVQKRMFQLSVMGQGLKTLSMVLGGFTFQIMAAEVVLPWTFIPVSPVIFLMILTDGIATAGLYLGRDWGFHLTLLMVPISFIETMLTLNPLVFMLAIWVLTIFIPCLARDGFYSKVFANVRAESVPNPRSK
jgi:hypothetical protein